jgi:predicted O-linked N-acetylglucosamine transferase (SPINDLY family)
MSKIARNKPCPCGSGKKNKYCCGDAAAATLQAANMAEQYNEQGNACAERWQLAEAIVCYERALAINPNFAGAWNNLGITCKDLKQIDRAIGCYRRALELAPGFAGVWNNLGNAFKEQGRRQEALSCYRKAQALVPDSVQVTFNLGNILYDLYELTEAISCFRRVLETSPDFSVWCKMGFALLMTGNCSESVACYQQALKYETEPAVVLLNMGSAYTCQGNLEEAVACYHRAIAVNPDDVDAYNGLVMAQQYVYSIDSKDLYFEALKFAKMFEAALPNELYNIEVIPKSEGKLRIGFVSGDLRNHSVGFFLVSVLRHIDRDSFTLVAYVNQVQEADDSLSEYIKPCFEQWIRIAAMSDGQLADRIRTDGIDLLVDLSGHSYGNRLLAFARKPAPVQATWLGYPNTTGLDSMDYIIADPITIPPEEEQHYSEKVWRLPETYLCFTPPDFDVTLNSLPVLEKGHITFGCFNNPAKMNDTVIACWAAILGAVPDAVLLLKYKNFDHEIEREVVRRRFMTCGIDPTRLRFIGALSHREHLAAYHQIDMALDPFPYTGVTTTCEALWMGVPTLTMRMARGMFGHNGELIMKSVGLDEWVVESIEEYRERAVALAGNPAWLATLRSSLRDALLSSPLCAAERFARNLESAFRGMISQSQTRYCRERNEQGRTQ